MVCRCALQERASEVRLARSVRRELPTCWHRAAKRPRFTVYSTSVVFAGGVGSMGTPTHLRLLRIGARSWFGNLRSVASGQSAVAVEFHIAHTRHTLPNAP